MNYSARAFHILVFSRCVVALLFATGCVATPQYEQVSSAVEVERESHRRTHVALEQARARLANLEGRLSETEGTLDDEAGQRAELDLKRTQSERELRASAELATELRAEIARLRDSLERFDERNQALVKANDKLEEELLEARRCDAQEPTDEPETNSPRPPPPSAPDEGQARLPSEDAEDEPPPPLRAGSNAEGA